MSVPPAREIPSLIVLLRAMATGTEHIKNKHDVIFTAAVRHLETLLPDPDRERLINEIDNRVRPTICQTYSWRGETSEGRISEDDFDYLLGCARR